MSSTRTYIRNRISSSYSPNECLYVNVLWVGLVDIGVIHPLPKPSWHLPEVLKRHHLIHPTHPKDLPHGVPLRRLRFECFGRRSHADCYVVRRSLLYVRQSIGWPLACPLPDSLLIPGVGARQPFRGDLYPRECAPLASNEGEPSDAQENGKNLQEGGTRKTHFVCVCVLV